MALSDSEAPTRCHRPPMGEKMIFVAEPIAAGISISGRRQNCQYILIDAYDFAL
jgi:hypothetical protein